MLMTRRFRTKHIDKGDKKGSERARGMGVKVEGGEVRKMAVEKWQRVALMERCT